MLPKNRSYVRCKSEIKVEPFPGSLSALSEPPIAVASLWPMGNPRPVPFVTAPLGLTCTNGSKIEELEVLLTLAVDRISRGEQLVVLKSVRVSPSDSERKRRGTAFTVPRSLPSRLGRSAAALVCSARSSSAARCFSAFSSGDACLFTGEFVRGSLLVRGASTFRCNRALSLRVHRRKSAGCLADVTRAARFSSAVIATAHSTTSTSDHSASAPLVHPLILVVALVCHYRSPAAIFEFNDAAAGRASVRP
jgi:hypothetical protein